MIKGIIVLCQRPGAKDTMSQSGLANKAASSEVKTIKHIYYSDNKVQLPSLAATHGRPFMDIYHERAPNYGRAEDLSFILYCTSTSGIRLWTVSEGEVKPKASLKALLLWQCGTCDWTLSTPLL